MYGSFLILIVLNGVHSWAFTDINYEKLAETEQIEEALALPKISLIYPGTKWCGPGNIAEDDNDLGTNMETDSCCRTHDQCPDIIPGFGTKHNLTNTAFYTRLNCSCDENFRQCLHAANETAARNVGLVYFNAINTKCFREDYPVTGCKRRAGILATKCKEYEYDTTGEPLYQWFDVQSY